MKRPTSIGFNWLVHGIDLVNYALSLSIVFIVFITKHKWLWIYVKWIEEYMIWTMMSLSWLPFWYKIRITRRISSNNQDLVWTKNIEMRNYLRWRTKEGVMEMQQDLSTIQSRGKYWNNAILIHIATLKLNQWLQEL